MLGRSPEKALALGAVSGETLPTWTGKQGIVAVIGKFCVGDCRFAAQPAGCLFVGELVQLLVDRAVDPADEEARDAFDPRDITAGALQVLKPGDIGFDDLLVDIDGKKAE